MKFTKMDDPIKGIGFVAIYFANLEDELDELIDLSNGFFIVPSNIKKMTFRNKVEWLQKQFRARFATHTYNYADQESVKAENIFMSCRKAAIARNDILHRPLFGGFKGGALRKDKSGKMKAVDIKKIYLFAEHIFSLVGAVYGLRFILGRLSSALQR